MNDEIPPGYRSTVAGPSADKPDSRTKARKAAPRKEKNVRESARTGRMDASAARGWLGAPAPLRAQL
jgi:hypothetical protein